MAVPQVTCDANIERNYSTSAQLITLGATATGSPTSWQWTMLDVPVSSTANVGINEDFVDGVSIVQNPNVYVDASVSGAYVFQAIATNGDGSSDPEIDRDSGQQVIYVKTQHRGLKVPNDYQYNWSDDLNETITALINTKLDEVDEPTAGSTTLDSSTSKHGLCPALSGDATEFLDGSGVFSTPSGVVPSTHGSTHTSIGSDSIPNVSTLASGLCPILSNSASEFLDGEGNWNAPSVAAHNTEHITGGSDIIPEVTTTEVGLCPTLPTVDPTTKFLRGDKTWDTPPTLGAHAAEHIDSGSDTIPVATASNTGLLPVRSGSATDYFDGEGNWTVPVGGTPSLDGAYNSGESITVDALPVTLNRTQTADDQSAQKINHAYNGNQGSGIEFIGSASSDTPDTETIRGVNVSIPKQSTIAELWYAVGGTTIAKKFDGVWSEVTHGLTVTEIYDIKGFAADDIWICGKAPNGSNGKSFVAHYDGVSWTMDTAYDALVGSYDDAYAASIYMVSSDEFYVLHSENSDFTVKICSYTTANGWVNKGGGNVNDGPYFDMAKYGNQFVFDKQNRHEYTNNIYASTPSWTTNTFVGTDRPHCTIYEPVLDRYLTILRWNSLQTIYVRRTANAPDITDSWTDAGLGSYDGGSGGYGYDQGFAAHSTWHDGLGNVFHTANHTVSNHVFLYNVSTATPVGVATTDKVYGMYGLSASNIKIGTDKTGYLKIWNGAAIGDENTGVSANFKQVWGMADASGTAKFEGSNVAFTGSGSNEATAIRIGSGATHAIKADSGIITLGKMSDVKHIADSGSLFAKEVNGIVEAHYRDDQANIIQLTRDGVIKTNSMAKIYSDDTYQSTSNTTYTQVKSFRHIPDSNRLPTGWLVLVTLWTSATSAECEVAIGSDTVEISTTATTETLDTGLITRTVDGDNIYNVTVKIKITGTGTAYLQYTKIYAIYGDL